MCSPFTTISIKIAGYTNTHTPKVLKFITKVNISLRPEEAMFWPGKHTFYCKKSVPEKKLTFVQLINWNKTEWEHPPTWLLGHLMPLVLASVSHQANNIINCTIAFLRLWQLKRGEIWLFWSCNVININNGIIWCSWHWCWCQAVPLHWCQIHVLWTAPSEAPFYPLGQVDWNEMQHTFFVMWHHLCWLMCTYETTMSVFIPHELNAISNVTTHSSIKTFNIIEIWPWANMPAILNLHVPLHYYRSLHIDSTLLHI